MLTSTGSTEHGGLLKSPNGAPINSRNKALDKLEVFLLKTIKNIVDLPKREINHWEVQTRNNYIAVIIIVSKYQVFIYSF